MRRQVAFAYGGHNVVLEIQATLPHPPSTVKPMMKGVYVAYAIVLWCYFSVSVPSPSPLPGSCSMWL